MTVWLYWAWADSREHDERKAPYVSLEEALPQAEHDLKLARDSRDFSQAPLRIVDEDGNILWEPDTEA